jgi:hypothetical protein
MAYGFGTGVQAGLGATDYSNYLRGALSGAQMSAQGTAAIGQGIQNALGSIGQGIKKYQENKVLQAEIMGGVEGNINFLSNNKPEKIKDAPLEIQRIFKRLEDGKGVSLKDSAYLKSWSDSATKQAKLDIENNAFASAIAFNEDGTAPTGQQAAMRYFAFGGTDKGALEGLLAFGKNPLEVELLKQRTKGQELGNTQTEQAIKGTTPLTEREKQQLAIQREEAAARKAAAEAAAARQVKADERAESAALRDEQRLKLAQEANARAEAAANASASGATEKARVEALSNQAISIFNQGEEQFNEFFNKLSPVDQGVVLSQVNQFKRGIPDEQKLSPSAIAGILMQRVNNKGMTFGEYIKNTSGALSATEDKYVIEGPFNDIKKIPAFEALLDQFPQFRPPMERLLPSGGKLRENPAQN